MTTLVKRTTLIVRDLQRSIAGLAAKGIEAERIIDHPVRRAVTIRDREAEALDLKVFAVR